MDRRYLALVMLAALVPGSAGPLRAASSTRLRLGVVTDGIIRLTPADLQAAGVDPGTVDPRTFALSSMGHPVAIQVYGEADGQFNAGGSILFFGEKFRGPEMDQKYTDERVYGWTSAGRPAHEPAR